LRPNPTKLALIIPKDEHFLFITRCFITLNLNFTPKESSVTHVIAFIILIQRNYFS